MRALRGVSRRLSTPALKPPSAHALGWRVTPVAHALGAEIEGADLSHIGATEFAAVREALLQYEVIFFRDQASFDPAAHRALAQLFGGVQTHPAYATVEGFPEITILENDRERPSLIEKWHTDMTFRPRPPLGSILHGIVIPDGGRGDTEFLSMSAAFEALEPSLRRRLAGLEGSKGEVI